LAGKKFGELFVSIVKTKIWQKNFALSYSIIHIRIYEDCVKNS